MAFVSFISIPVTVAGVIQYVKVPLHSIDQANFINLGKKTYQNQEDMKADLLLAQLHI